MTHRSTLELIGVIGLVALITAAADPSATPGASLEVNLPPTSIVRIEAWLDRPVPTDVAPGSTVQIGATIWNRSARELVPTTGVFLWWRPAVGDGVPSEASGQEDWHGHSLYQIVVPQGGPGKVEIGFRGANCSGDSCEPDNVLFPIAGIGPPPDAPLPRIAAMEINPPQPIVAGQPASVALALRPRADWSSDVFAAPGQLFLVARIPHGETLAVVPAILIDAPSGRYLATINLPEAGRYVLEASVSAEPTSQGTFSTALVTIDVRASAEASAEPNPTAGDPTGPDWLLPIMLVAIATLIVGGLVIVVRHEG